MNPGTPPPPGATPAAPASIVTCPSCHNPLQVDLSMGLEGPCPICGFYLRLVAPPAAGMQPVAAPPVATGDPIKPAPREVPAGAQRREIPHAREPVYRAPRSENRGRARRRKSKTRQLFYLASRFMASPGGRMVCGVIIALGIFVTIFSFFRWDKRTRARQLELQHPSPPVEPAATTEPAKQGFQVDESELRIPGAR